MKSFLSRACLGVLLSLLAPATSPAAALRLLDPADGMVITDVATTALEGR